MVGIHIEAAKLTVCQRAMGDTIEADTRLVEAAHRHGIWCGICGEAAGYLHLTPIWIGIGVDELSVGSSQVLRMRWAISKLEESSCREFAEGLRQIGAAGEIRRQCETFVEDAYPELLL